ncbi:MAG TPA: pantetheine-phosphate adenylyltransferase [Bacteroidales bacterium]|nr:pantetheine-phosphate adenylyltransferase [Bacteroidales bacterium]HNS46548.1 pantetheine-phosphate adenylyltransferase [Bacteroidales bacterium]
MKKIAVFPGSFDPITRGHESIVQRALSIFDEIIIAVGQNIEKKYFFPLDRRMEWIRKVFNAYPQIRVESYQGLTVDFCRENGVLFIVRGLRTSADFEFERSIGQINKQIFPDIETVFLLATPEFTALNSSIVRDIIRNDGNPNPFIPEAIHGYLH